MFDSLLTEVQVRGLSPKIYTNLNFSSFKSFANLARNTCFFSQKPNEILKLPTIIYSFQAMNSKLNFALMVKFVFIAVMIFLVPKFLA